MEEVIQYCATLREHVNSVSVQHEDMDAALSWYACNASSPPERQLATSLGFLRHPTVSVDRQRALDGPSTCASRI